MLLFWRQGYESTSVSELTKAMGVTPPSLYAAFGDKKGLFLEAVQRYRSGPITSERIIDEAPTARDAACNLLQAAATGFTGQATPSGCLLASSAISCSGEAADIQEHLASIRRGIEEQLRLKMAKAQLAGEFSSDVDVEALAAYIMAVVQGMSTLARDGATREKLLCVAGTAMRRWPTA